MRCDVLRLALVAATLVVHPPGLRAQSALPLGMGPGARVRVTAPAALTPSRREGRVLAFRNDTLRLVLEGRPDALAGPPDTVALPTRQITSLELSGGQHAATRKGLGFGALVGVTIGALAGAVSYRSPICAAYRACDATLVSGRDGAAVVGGIVGGLAGLAIGGVAGALHVSERWESMSLPQNGRVNIVPDRNGGLALSLEMRF